MKVEKVDSFPEERLSKDDLLLGQVYMDVADKEYYIVTDNFHIVELRTGFAYDMSQTWVQNGEFLEVKAKLVVEI